jgi:hypothetical protein
MKLLFFDFEVFSHDFLMTAILADGTRKRIHNNITAFKSFYNAHKDYIWIGFNSKSYDNRIVKVLMNSETDQEAIANAWWANTKIIGERNVGAVYQRFNMNKYPLIGYDLILTGDRTLSLKDSEGFLGLTIKESSVPWNIDRPLTQEELEEVFYYNGLDVEATIEVFNYRAQNLKDKLHLINLFNLQLTDLVMTDTQITSKIMKAKPMDGADALLPIKPMKFMKINDQRVIDFYAEPLDYKKKLTLDVNGMKYEYGWGGFHTALANFIGESKHYLQIDVSSMYPAWIVKQKHMPRSFDKSMMKEGEQWFYDRVNVWKPNHDPRADTFKLIMNGGWFGASKDENSNSYDPRAANLITVHGQMGITDLIERVLEAGAKLIQGNTDGILVEYTDDNYEAITEAAHEWESRYNFELEFDKIDRVWQFNVNNYIVQYPDGKIKVKGAMVKQSKFADKSSREFQNSESILADMVVNYLVNDVDPKDTIREAYKNNEVMAFQRIMKVGKSNYQRVWYGEDREEVYFTNRTFASKDTSLGKLFKVKILSNDQFGDKQQAVIDKYNLEIELVRASERSEAQKDKMIQTRYRQREKALQALSKLSVSEAVGLQADHVLIYNEAITDDVKLKDLNLDFNYYLDKGWDLIERILPNERSTNGN